MDITSIVDDPAVQKHFRHRVLSCGHIKHSFIKSKKSPVLTVLKLMADLNNVELPVYHLTIDQRYNYLRYLITMPLRNNIILDLALYHSCVKLSDDNNFSEITPVGLLEEFTETNAPFLFDDLQLDFVDIKVPYSLFKSKEDLFKRLKKIIPCYQSDHIGFREGVHYGEMPANEMIISTGSYVTVELILNYLTFEGE